MTRKTGRSMLKNWAWVGCAFALSGCASVGPDYVEPTMPMPSGFAAKTATAAPATTPATMWWASFRDKTLNGLVDDALASNLDVAEAIERVVEARASARLNNAGAYPTLDSEASYARQDSGSGASDEWSLQASASWELDLFGRYRRQREVGRADVAAAVEDVNAARLSLLGDITEAYVQTRAYQARLVIARESLSAWRETLDLTRTKFAAGAVDALDVAQSEAEVASAAADIPSLESSLRASIMDLGVLLGTQPASIVPLFNRGGRIPYPVASVGAGVPADLLRNRPDIREAERTLAAATAQIGVAAADLYPSLSLSGLISTVASSAAKLGSAGTVSWSFGPTIDWAIFDGGKRRSQVEVYRSQAQQQHLAWQSLVLNAVAEVEKALTAYVQERRRKDALERAVSQYSRAVALADERYRGGSGDFFSVLEARRSLDSSRDSLAQSEAQLAVNYITLNLALGGGWNAGAV